MRRQDSSDEEIAAYSLSAAHYFIRTIYDITLRQYHSAFATSISALRIAQQEQRPESATDEDIKQSRILSEIEKEQLRIIEQRISTLNGFGNVVPMTGGLSLEEYLGQMDELNFSRIADDGVSPLAGMYPIRQESIHFLHKMAMMGILPPRACGSYRKKPVSVGFKEVYFAPPNCIPPLMEEYCNDFPILSPLTTKGVIVSAAIASYRFVKIHPYSDGNGRVSRLLMNVILTSLNFPPIAIKADGKGRKRYQDALERADKGDKEPLACLIASSIVSTLEMLLDSIGGGVTGIMDGKRHLN